MTRYSLESLSETILQASGLEELAAMREEVLEYAHDRAFLFTANAADEQRAVNAWHDCLIRRVLELTEQEMTYSGAGAPPAEYDFVLFGSGGRKEQTLWSDQDNGIVYANPQGREEAGRLRIYFLEFGKRLSEALARVGYPPCEGEVLCRNERWCKPLAEWEDEISGWYRDPTWEHVRYLLITADMRCLAGRGEWTGRIRRKILDGLKQDRSAAGRLLENTLRHKMLVGIFGQFLKERYGEGAGGIDIKYGAYIPFVNGIRLLSMLHGVDRTPTLERLQMLEEIGAVSPLMAKEWREAFSLFIDLRARTMHRREGSVWTSNGTIKLDRLSKNEVRALKIHLKTGKALQRFVKLSVDRYRE